jgi:uncharacterized membrane protein YdbT with pleckstrin-like domain
MAPERQTIAQQLRCLHFFRRLPDDTLQAIAMAAEPVSVRAGEILVRQGDAGDSFFIIQRGKFQVTVRRGKQSQPAGIRISGDSIGEEELLHRRPRSVSVTALEESSLLRWRNDRFAHWLHSHPSLRTSLRIAAASRRQARQMNPDWLRKTEGVQLIARKHPFFVVLNLVGPAIAFLAVAAIFTYLYLAEAQSTVPFLCAGGLLGAAGLWAVWNVLDWSNDYYLVTNQRVVWLERVAAFYDSRQEAPLSTLLSVGVKTSQAGRIFGYGNVEVRTYTGVINFRRISHPERVADLIDDLWQRARVETKQEELTAMDQAIRLRLQKDTLNGSAGRAASAPLLTPSLEVHTTARQGLLARFFSNLFHMRYETGAVITYRKHWYVLIRSTSRPVLWMVAGLGVMAARIAQVFTLFSIPAVVLICGGVVLASFFWLLYEYLDWRNDIYQVTPDQIMDIDRKPFGREEKRSAPIENILSIQYERLGLTGLVLNFGTVSIIVGAAKFTFDYVYNPSQVQQDLFQRMEEHKARQRQEEILAERERVADWFAAYDQVARENNGHGRDLLAARLSDGGPPGNVEEEPDDFDWENYTGYGEV